MSRRLPVAAGIACLLAAVVVAQTPGGLGQSPVPVYVTSGSGFLASGTVAAGPVLFADGTSGAPSIAFQSEPTLGIWRSAAGIITLQATSVAVAGAGLLQAGSLFTGSGLTRLDGPANGVLNLLRSNSTTGSQLKVDALPVASACGGGSPAVVAGSTPLSGAVTVGTGGPTTCTVTFGGTAYPSAAHCNGVVETTTGANTRLMGYSATATVLTITPSAAWADGSVVNWDCYSPK